MSDIHDKWPDDELITAIANTKELFDLRKPCREQSNESDMRGRCMRCGKEQGQICPM